MPKPPEKSAMADFDRAFQDALPKKAREVDDEMKASPRMAAMGGAPLALIDIGAIIGPFCSKWPAVKAGLLKALWFYSWIDKENAAMGRAFISAFETKLLPTVCPKP